MSLDTEAAVAMAGIERGITVGLIATPRSELKTCEVHDPALAVLKRDDVKHFDFVPVLSEDRIVGLFDRLTVCSQALLPDGSVGHHMERLSEVNLVAADASALTFVSMADQRPCCLVLGGEGISGIVTFADLQRLPVRPMLFALVTHLEILMTRAIKLVHGEDDNWLRTLGKKDFKDLRRRWRKQRESESELDKLSIATLSQKASSLAGTSELGELSKRFSDSVFGPIQDLRNGLAHPKESGAPNDYAASRDAAFKTAETVRSMQKLIVEISGFCRNRSIQGMNGAWPLGCPGRGRRAGRS